MTAPVIHGDPELTGIVARALIVSRYVESCGRAPWRHIGPNNLRELALRLIRGDVLAILRTVAGFWGAATSTDEPIFSFDLDSVHDGPANAARRFVLHGTEHADLCANGLTMCSMHLQAQEVAR